MKNSIRTADEFSTKLPVTDLNGAPHRGAVSNLHWYKTPTVRWAFFIRALVPVTLQPINYLLYIVIPPLAELSNIIGIFKGAKV